MEKKYTHRGAMGTWTLPVPGVQKTSPNHDPTAKIALKERNIDWTGHSAVTIFFFFI